MGRQLQDSFQSLGNFSPRLLCQYFSQFPADLAKAGIVLPAHPTDANVPLEALTALLAKTEEFQDPILEHSARMIFSMKSQASRDTLQKELALWGKRLLWHADYSPFDMPLACWMQHPDILEKAYGREAMLLKRSFVYYPTAQNAAGSLVVPTDASVKVFAAKLEQDLITSIGLGFGLWIVPYVEKNYITFLLRYAESTKRKGIVRKDRKSGTVSFKPEEFKSVVYGRRHGDLRIFAPEKVCPMLRMKFGLLLFGDLFHFADRQVFFLDQLMDGSLSHIHCGDVKGIDNVSLRALTYTVFAGGEAEYAIRAKDGQCLLRTHAKSALFPPNIFRITQAEYFIKFPHRKEPRPLVIHEGNEAQFAVEEHSERIEDWLRLRNLLRSGMSKTHDKAA